MTISFNQVPSNIRVPGVYTEIDNSRALAGAQRLNYRRLLIGTKLAAGTAPVNVPVQCLSSAAGEGLFGAGSVAAGMVAAALAADAFTDLWVLPILDPAAGALATATITVTGPATASGTLQLYVAGRKVSVGVTSGDAATAIATKIAAAITALAGLPVTAAAAAAVVTLSARNKGETGNALEVRANYYGEALPAGVTVAVTAFTGGTGNPDISTALAALGDSWFQAIATAYTDTANLVLLENDQNSRWGPLRAVEGHVFGCLKGTVSSIGTIGLGRNNEHVTLVASINEPTPAYEKAAETMAIWAFAVSNDPARPVQNLAYVWSLPAVEQQRPTTQERNILLYDGIATTKVTSAGVMQAERLITTFQKNSAGGADVSYLDSETMATLLYLRHSWEDRIKARYPRSKLADDGNRFGDGQDVVTPKQMKAEQVAWAIEMQEIGLVENIPSYKALSFAERDVGDRNRMNNLLAPDLVNQLRIVGNKIQFIL